MKNFYFLSGFMRCGNTVLTSLVNQNPDLCITPNSITPEIMFKLHELKQGSIFKEQKDEKSLDSVIKDVLPSYYKNWKQKHIIERGPWGTPFNYAALKEAGYLPSKFIFLVRPIKEILASFIKIRGPKKTELETFCDLLMQQEGGPIGKSLFAYNHLVENKEKIHIIKYHELCKNPEKILKNLYKFLEIDYYPKHRFTKLKQVDTSLGRQTKIRTDKVELKKHDYGLWIPKTTLKKYENSFIY